MNNVLSAAACDDFHCSTLSSLQSVLLKCPHQHSNYFTFSDLSPETEMVVAAFFPSHEKCMLVIWAWQKGLPLLCMFFFPKHHLFGTALGNEQVTTITHQHKSESYCSTHAFTCPQLVLLNSLKIQTQFSKSWLVLRTGTSLKNTLFFPGALALVPITEKCACLLVWLSHNSKLCCTLFVSYWSCKLLYSTLILKGKPAFISKSSYACLILKLPSGEKKKE